MSETGITQSQATRTAIRDQALSLRAQGLTRAQIRDHLGLPSDWALHQLLDGQPATHPGLRTQAKDDKRHQARELRTQGWTYKEIAREIHVSMSSLSLWLRDLPKPETLPGPVSETVTARRVEAIRAAARRRSDLRELERDAAKRAAEEQIGSLTDREILLTGAIAYWCEGEKDKTYRRAEKVNFINSDPDLIRCFLRFLDVAGVERSRLRYRVHVHESADIDGVTRFWEQVVRAGPDVFDRPNIKMHSPRTNRKNTAGGYRGCLQIRVRGSRDLYRKIDGWAHAVMACGG